MVDSGNRLNELTADEHVDINTDGDGAKRVIAFGFDGTDFVVLSTNSAGDLNVTSVVEVTTTGTNTQVSVGTGSTAVLASNASRRGYAIHNDGTQTAFLNFGGTAVVTDFPLNRGQSWTDSGQGVYTGAIAGITASSTADVRIVEFT